MEAKNSYGSANVVGTSLLSPFTVKARLRHYGQRFRNFGIENAQHLLCLTCWLLRMQLGVAVGLFGLRDCGFRDFHAVEEGPSQTGNGSVKKRQL